MKNILLAISGLTPQIVTETLYSLSVKRKIIIDEIYIVTTSRGKSVIEGRDNSTSTPDIPLKKEITELCRMYNLKHPKFTLKKNVIVAEEESHELFDIKTDKENKLFPNKVAELIKKIASNPDIVIHASLSGGRKSMSAHLALALSLFARSHDKLYHILTDEEFEFNNFFPKSKKEEKALVLAEIPFVKLRSLNAPILKSDFTYSQIVNKTQKQLKFLTENDRLVIDIRKLIIKYKENSIKLTPIEISIYVQFVQRKINLGEGIAINEIKSVDFAKSILDFMVEYFNYYVDKRNNKHWSVIGFDDKYFLTAKSKINKKIKSIFDDMEIAEKFTISTIKRYGNSTYIVKSIKKKLGINYD